ncbi:urease accessory protein UreD [Phyllobacterium sp. YR531]|uniref:urease accessory protein UreD n=1 Tax=Phyllobacterium sp. YR531 TaxID=1144343 RepID=UPI0012F6DD9D|nr:urease accessory protein UreD [Phyllobacterium sp. YR531]
MLDYPLVVQGRAQRASGTGRLSVRKVEGKTRIAKLFQEGCAKLRFPVVAEDGLEAVMINSAGGLTGGDAMQWNFVLGDFCNAHITTQACEKIYKAVSGTVATVSTHIEAGKGSFVAWLPQETILFEAADLKRSLNVNLAADAKALLVESTIFGRKAFGETIDTVRFSDQWRVRQEGQLIHAENFAIGPNAGSSLKRSALFGDYRAVTTVLLVSPHCEQLLEPARLVIGERGGASSWMGKLLVRMVDIDAYHLRKRLIPLLRLLNGGAELPRIWST